MRPFTRPPQCELAPEVFEAMALFAPHGLRRVWNWFHVTRYSDASASGEIMLVLRGMRWTARHLPLLMSLGVGHVCAQSLTCSDGSVREGDGKVWLLRYCGQPSISDNYCRREVLPPVPVPNGNGVLYQPTSCVMIEEWLYERGPGNLVAVVRIREGRIISIRFGEQGRYAPR